MGVGDWRVRYRWPERYLWTRGIDVRSGSKDTDITLIGALLLASLMTRGWNQESAGTGEQDKYPAGRLRLLSEEIGHRRNQLPRPGDTDPGAVWAVLNQAAKKIFGRSIVEELKQDFAREKEFIENYVKNFDPPAIAAVTDVHRLRGELIDVLTARPQEFFDPECWSMTMLPKLHVGCTLLYPAGLKTCFGVTWAGRFGETERFGAEYGLRETEAWRKVESAATTFAKFMVNGRVDPALIPGALAKLEEQLADQYGVTILVERLFAYPPRSGTQAFFRLAQVDDLPCDICNKNVHKPRGCLIPSYTVRVERPPNADPQDARFKDDWRDWLACEECARRYASFGSKLS